MFSTSLRTRSPSLMSVITDTLFKDKEEDINLATNSLLFGQQRRVELLSKDISDQILKDLQMLSKDRTRLTDDT